MEKIDTLSLFTDYYELTMAQGLFRQGNPQVEFYAFFRHNIQSNGYSVFCGIDQFLEDIKDVRFSEDDIKYLRDRKIFAEDFVKYLEDFRFGGDIYSFAEGSVVFPYEPVVRVRGNFVECTLLEGMLLNYLNCATSVATKASRIVNLVPNKPVMEFGMRRAPFFNAALAASRASYIAGCSSTSNTLAGRLYGIPVSGTMAHSWIMSFDSELAAFREFAALYPDNCILLIDTYNTLESGVKNAIAVGLEQRRKGKKIGVRIDSGDLSYLSKEVRKALDSAGLNDALICLSNDIDENIICQLLLDRTPVDSFGIGTKLVTPEPTGFVYKLSGICRNGKWEDKMKVSSSKSKLTLPGTNQVYRLYDSKGVMLADLIEPEDSFERKQSYRLYHPIKEENVFVRDVADVESKLHIRVKDGNMVEKPLSVADIRTYCSADLAKLHPSSKRLVNPHTYKVSLGDNLKRKRDAILDRILSPES